ncbi:MAG: MMPL family transporter [Thiogranum sp.]
MSNVSLGSRCRAFPRLVCRFPWLVIATVLVLTLVALSQIFDPFTGELKLQIDPSDERLVGQSNDEWQFYQTVRRMFGNDEALLVVVEAQDVFVPETLALIKRLTDDLSAVDGVQSVISLSNVLTLRNTDVGLDIAPLMKQVPETPEAADELRKEALANRLIGETLVSKNGDTTGILVNLKNTQGYQFLREVNARLDEIVRRDAQGARIWITGAPRIQLATTDIILDDLLRFPPLITCVMMVLLWLFMRSVTAVVVPLVTVIVSVIWTVGTLVALGYSLNIVTALVPPLLMIITLSYSMYVVSDLRIAGRGEREGLHEFADVLYEISLPIMLAGLTTAIGFLSLTLSHLPAISEFGLFSVIGVIYAALLALTLSPSLIQLLERGSNRVEIAPRVSGPTAFDRLIQAVARFDAEHRSAIFVAAGVVVVIAGLGMAQLRVGTEHITNFRPDSEVRQAFEHANDRLGGINPVSVIVQADYSDAFKQPGNLHEIEVLQEWLESQPEVGGVTSLVDYIEAVNSAFNDNDPAFQVIPDSKQSISQLLFFAESDETERLVDSRYQTVNLMVRARAVDAEQVQALVDRIQARLRQLPEHLHGRVTGHTVLVNQAIEEIMWGQLKSIASTLVIVYGVLTSLFLSFWIGFMALIPNLLPVLAYFGALGIAGVSLNPSTSLIAPMVIGIAIDDTVHYFARLNSFAKRCPDPKQSTQLALGAVGRPMTYTSLALCIGFLLLTTSELRMQVQVGAMASFALAVAWLSDFFLTPALCTKLRIATLWDVLTLDLGARPQETIPLFKGLSSFQARIVSRMASIREVRGGERIIEVGQPAEEMFTVVGGKLQVSIEGGNGRIQLATLSRGDTFGEAGLFFVARTADVDVVEDARLICITRENLETLRRRYPRIAARVFGNLNEILSRRLARATDRLR